MWGLRPGPGGEGDAGLQWEVLEAPRPLGRYRALRQLPGVRRRRGAWGPASRAAQHGPVRPEGSARGWACSSGAACLLLRSEQAVGLSRGRRRPADHLPQWGPAGLWFLTGALGSGFPGSFPSKSAVARLCLKRTDRTGRLHRAAPSAGAGHTVPVIAARRGEGHGVSCRPQGAAGVCVPVCVFPPDTHAASDHKQRWPCRGQFLPQVTPIARLPARGGAPLPKEPEGRGGARGHWRGGWRGDPSSEQGSGGGCSGQAEAETRRAGGSRTAGR